MNFKVLKSEVKVKSRVFDFRVDEIEYENGETATRDVAVHPGGAVVLPLKNDGKIVLVKQYRYPLDMELYELPAGKLDYGEDPLECATRELTEETGYTAGNIKKLGAIHTTPGFCNEVLHIYIATDLTLGETNRELGEEGMEVYEFSVGEIIHMINEGKITDAKTICGMFYYQNLM